MTLTLDFPDCDRSPWGRLDPRWKLASLLPAMIAIALLRTFWPAFSALCGTWILILLLKLPLRWYLTRLLTASLLLGLFVAFLPFLPDPENAYISIGPLSLSEHGLKQAGVLLIRGIALVTLSTVLVAG